MTSTGIARLGWAPSWRCSRRCLLALALAALVGAVTLGGEFVYDDRAAILENPIVQGKVSALSAFRSSVWGEPLGPGISSYRPLTPLFWRVIWWVFPAGPGAYRAVSLLLHVLAVGLFWRLGRALGSEEGALAAAAVLFAVHPAHAEAVGSIVGQADILASCIGLIAMEVCVRARRWPGTWASALLLAAWLVKESALPFAAGAVVLLALRDETAFRRLRAGAAVLAVTVGFVMFQLSLPRSTEHWNNSLTHAAQGSQRLLLGAHLVGRAVAMVVAPSGFSPVHGYAALDLSWRTLAPFALFGCAVLAAVGVASGVAAQRRSRTALLALIFLVGPPLLLSGLLVRMPTDLPERLLYPSTMAASALAAMLIFRRSVVRVRAAALAGLALVFFTVGVFAQRPWRSEEALWEHAVRVEPKAIRGQMNLAQVRYRQGRIEEAAWHRLLAAWINDRYPNPPSWAPVTQLEQELSPLLRISEAPRRLQPEDPCRLVHGMLGVYRQTLPEFETRAVQLFRGEYPGCFVPGITGAAAGPQPPGAPRG